MTSVDSFDNFEAQIGNKVVTVGTLRVDGKKMTLQFFKQIPRQDWLDEELVPRTSMTVWGRVHYRIPDEGTEWLLFQLEGQLKRCSIDRPAPYMFFLERAQRDMESASDAVQRHELEVVEAQRAVESANSAELKQVHEKSLAMRNAWLHEARKKVADSRTAIQQELEKHERIRRRAARIDELAAVPQLYIGA